MNPILRDELLITAKRLSRAERKLLQSDLSRVCVRKKVLVKNDLGLGTLAKLENLTAEIEKLNSCFIDCIETFQRSPSVEGLNRVRTQSALLKDRFLAENRLWTDLLESRNSQQPSILESGRVDVNDLMDKVQYQLRVFIEALELLDSR